MSSAHAADAQRRNMIVISRVEWEEYHRFRRGLEAIRDHGNTHDQPCYAISNGDCAEVMQEIARTALA